MLTDYRTRCGKASFQKGHFPGRWWPLSDVAYVRVQDRGEGATEAAYRALWPIAG